MWWWWWWYCYVYCCCCCCMLMLYWRMCCWTHLQLLLLLLLLCCCCSTSILLSRGSAVCFDPNSSSCLFDRCCCAAGFVGCCIYLSVGNLVFTLSPCPPVRLCVCTSESCNTTLCWRPDVVNGAFVPQLLLIVVRWLLLEFIRWTYRPPRSRCIPCAKTAKHNTHKRHR